MAMYEIKFVIDLRQVVCFSPRTPVFSTNKSDRHDIAEILLKIAVNIITHNPISRITIFKMCLLNRNVIIFYTLKSIAIGIANLINRSLSRVWPCVCLLSGVHVFLMLFLFI